MKTMMKLTALLLFVSFPAAMAEIGIKPILPDGKARPARSTILVVGDGVSADAVKAAQDESEDRFTFYVTEPKIGSATELLELLKGPERKTLLSKSWSAIHIGVAGDAEEDTKREITGIFSEGKSIVMWADADLSADRIGKAILRNGENLADWPKGEKRDPAKLLSKDGLLDDVESLAVLPSRTGMVFQAKEKEWQFNLHSFIAHHDGKFWAIWSSGRADEDSSSQLIRYATSEDGLKWTESGIVAPDPDGEDGPLRWLASGLYVKDGFLYALGCRNGGGNKGEVWSGAELIRFRWSDGGWKDEGVYADNSMVYFPPMDVKGRDFFVWRDAAAHFFTARSGPKAGEWEVKKHPSYPPDYRMSETASYVDADGVIHLIIRDQGKTNRLYHSLSFDDGDTWTMPVKTNYPDAVSKNFAGRLKDGRFYLINNPRADGKRDPLAISVGNDGWAFGQPRVIRKDAPERRYAGKFKNKLSFQYSDAMEHDGKLWVIYATNKEDIEVTAIDIKDLPKAD